MSDQMLLHAPADDAELASVLNELLAPAAVSITAADAKALALERRDWLEELERVEFGEPAVVAIARAIAKAPQLSEGQVARTLAQLQGAFYSLRDELSVEVPDAEIVGALIGCLEEVGDASELAAIDPRELMSYSRDYRKALEGDGRDTYRIVDEGGHAYVFGPDGWDPGETAPGWDGEEWADEWDERDMPATGHGEGRVGKP